MTLVFAAIGAVFFAAIGYRFVTRMTAREPMSSKAE